MRDHRNLKAFDHADALVVAVYRETRSFPREEIFGLTAQMRRGAVSVAANIVEGCAREGRNEYLNFLNMAFGSLREVGYYIDLSHRLGYLSDKSADALKGRYEECARILAGLMKSLRRS
jgi:four helix bundle protein